MSRDRMIGMPPLNGNGPKDEIQDWAVFVPGRYQPDASAGLMVFWGARANAADSDEILDTIDGLMDRGEIPVALVVFIAPRHEMTERRRKPDQSELEAIMSALAARFSFSSDPRFHVIGCLDDLPGDMFAVAWEHPDKFGKVLTIGASPMNGAETDYAALIRKTERKPIRIFNWRLSVKLGAAREQELVAHKQAAAALRYMGYDARWEFVDSDQTTYELRGAILRRALQWLWSPAEFPLINTEGDLASDMTLHRLLIEGEGWVPVFEGLASATTLCADARSNLYFSQANRGIFRMGIDGRVVRISEDSASGLRIGPDGRLYACTHTKKQLVAIDLQTGVTEVLKENIEADDLVILKSGWIYLTARRENRLLLVNPGARSFRTVNSELHEPISVALSPDQGTLVVTERNGQSVWAFRINADGSLDAKEPFMTMEQPNVATKASRAPAPINHKGQITGDSTGRFFVATEAGLQVFDPTGRFCGFLNPPRGSEPLISCTYVESEDGFIYASTGENLYRRRIQIVKSHIP